MKALPGFEGPPPEDDWIHPLDAAAIREPIPNGGVRVIVMAMEPGGPDPDAIGRGLLDLLKAREAAGRRLRRPARFEVGWDEALEQGLADGTHPIVLVSTAPGTVDRRPPRPAPEGDRRPGPRHRPAAGGEARSMVRHAPLACPVRLAGPTTCSPPAGPIAGRRWRRSSPSRSSRFLEVEILAKATFLTQVIEEVDVPPLASSPVGRIGATSGSFAQGPDLRPPVIATGRP